MGAPPDAPPLRRAWPSGGGRCYGGVACRQCPSTRRWAGGSEARGAQWEQAALLAARRCNGADWAHHAHDREAWRARAIGWIAHCRPLRRALWCRNMCIVRVAWDDPEADPQRGPSIGAFAGSSPGTVAGCRCCQLHRGASLAAEPLLTRAPQAQPSAQVARASARRLAGERFFRAVLDPSP